MNRRTLYLYRGGYNDKNLQALTTDMDLKSENNNKYL